VSSDGAAFGVGLVTGALLMALFLVWVLPAPAIHTLRCYDGDRLVLKAPARVFVPNADGEPVQWKGDEEQIGGCKVTRGAE
jgi:hypothetical protein